MVHSHLIPKSGQHLSAFTFFLRPWKSPVIRWLKPADHRGLQGWLTSVLMFWFPNHLQGCHSLILRRWRSVLPFVVPALCWLYCFLIWLQGTLPPCCLWTGSLIDLHWCGFGGDKKREQFTYPLYPLRVNEIFIYRPEAEMCQRYELTDLYQANFWESPFTQNISF